MTAVRPAVVFAPDSSHASQSLWLPVTDRPTATTIRGQAHLHSSGVLSLSSKHPRSLSMDESGFRAEGGAMSEFSLWYADFQLDGRPVRMRSGPSRVS